MTDRPTYFSLFAGIGGFDLAIKQSKINYRCEGYSEIDKYAIAIYSKHFKEHVNYGDATGIVSDSIPNFDLLVAGFPCQSFSVAGKRRGFQDSRGTLFFEIARLCADKRPGYILLENVDGLLSHEHGKTLQRMLGILTNIGYLLQWEVLVSSNYGVPQGRKRVFIVGHLRGRRRPEVFPISEVEGTFVQESPRSYTLNANYQKGAAKSSRTMIGLDYVGGILTETTRKWLDDGKEFSKNYPQGQRVYSADGLATSLSATQGGLGGKTGLYQVYDRYNNAWREKLGTLTAAEAKRAGWSICTNSIIRRLTPTECERLQGFPDNWTTQGIMNYESINISDSQRYKCLGNAVTVNVVRYIINKMGGVLDD